MHTEVSFEECVVTKHAARPRISVLKSYKGGSRTNKSLRLLKDRFPRDELACGKAGMARDNQKTNREETDLLSKTDERSTTIMMSTIALVNGNRNANRNKI